MNVPERYLSIDIKIKFATEAFEAFVSVTFWSEAQIGPKLAHKLDFYVKFDR